MRRWIAIVLLVILTGCAGITQQDVDSLLGWIKPAPSPSPIVTPPPVPEPVPIPPTPTPIPEPTPVPVPITDAVIVADMNTIPERMRAAGFQGSDNALYYALAFVTAFGPGTMPDDGAGSLIELSRRSPEIEKWWWDYVTSIRERLKDNPSLSATIITNDGRDRCGFRLGPPILERFKEFGDRVQLGTVVPESEY